MMLNSIMPLSYNEFVQQLDVGTAAQNFWFYLLIALMVWVICVQYTVLKKSKKRETAKLNDGKDR